MAEPQSTPMLEQWKPISGYEGLYEVSNLGRVKRLPRFQLVEGRWGPFHRLLAGQMLKPTLTDRYLCVHLWREGKGRSTRINILVCRHFSGEPSPERPHALHNNGDRMDNRAVNLRWGSELENARDRDRHGTTARGERQHSARLTAEIVRSIRKRVANGEVMAQIARELGVNKSSVQSVVHRQTWKHV